jgi:hypothetical protein
LLFLCLVDRIARMGHGHTLSAVSEISARDAAHAARGIHCEFYHGFYEKRIKKTRMAAVGAGRPSRQPCMRPSTHFRARCSSRAAPRPVPSRAPVTRTYASSRLVGTREQRLAPASMPLGAVANKRRAGSRQDCDSH